MLNAAQIHLAFNHIPVVGFLIASIVVLYGFVTMKDSVRSTGLAILLGTAIMGGVAYFSGEPAEEIVEHKAGVTEHAIHEHEEAAEFATVLMALTALSAIVAFLKAKKVFTAVTIILAFICSAALARTAHLGGLIRHDELASTDNSSSKPELENESNENDED